MNNSETTGNLQGSRLKAKASKKLQPFALDSVKATASREVREVTGKLQEKTKKLKQPNKEFSSVEHLSADAAAMFVDNELSRGAMHRARRHIIHCAECREEINRQRKTVEYLRNECRRPEVSAPLDLKAKLASLANECAPGPGAENLAMQRPESFVAKVESVVRAVRRTQGR